MGYRYDAFGDLFTQMAAPYNTTGYTGKTYDAKASLMDYSARWYSPSVGRFTAPDTYEGSLTDPLSLNRYVYVEDNPVNFTDLTGHMLDGGGSESGTGSILQPILSGSDSGSGSGSSGGTTSGSTSKTESGTGSKGSDTGSTGSGSSSGSKSTGTGSQTTTTTTSGSSGTNTGSSTDTGTSDTTGSTSTGEGDTGTVYHPTRGQIISGSDLTFTQTAGDQPSMTDTSDEAEGHGGFGIPGGAIPQEDDVGTPGSEFTDGSATDSAGADGSVTESVGEATQLDDEYGAPDPALVSGEEGQATGNEGTDWSTNSEGLPVGGNITGYTNHGAEQALGRDGGLGVSNEAIQDTVTNPNEVEEQPPTDPSKGPTYKYTGNDAVVVLNQNGKVVTTWATNSQGLRNGD